MAQQLPAGRNTVAAEAPMESAEAGDTGAPSTSVCDPPHLPGRIPSPHPGYPEPCRKQSPHKEVRVDALLLFNPGSQPEGQEAAMVGVDTGV